MPCIKALKNPRTDAQPCPTRYSYPCNVQYLCDQLDDTTSLGDLSLGLLGEPSSADDEWDLWETALSEDLGVAKWEEIDDWDGILGGGGEVLSALLGWDERPKLLDPSALFLQFPTASVVSRCEGIG
jgi:hypothetical protein